MKSRTYTFDGEAATVTWDRVRCIHFEACVHGLPLAFDTSRRPWIDPDQATPEELLDVVRRCPTGALHLRLSDGTDPEALPSAARVTVAADGPLYAHGDVSVLSAEGEEVLRDTRVALCRCGLSSNKPLCDNSHLDGFADPGRITPTDRDLAGEGDRGPSVVVRARPDGPLVVSGPLTVVGDGGEEIELSRAVLCRCGLSAKKPFCDGSHKAAGFQAT